MSYQPTILTDASLDAGQRLRVAQVITLGDLKTLGSDNLLVLENTSDGGGSVTWADNKATLATTSGGYAIRRPRQYFQYFTGKSHVVEMTFDGAQTQAGVTKRIGYFSSAAAAPYDTGFDGFWIEDDGSTKYFVVSRAGVEVHRTALVNWNGDRRVQTYDWSKFTVVMFDFLWLGGASLRLFLKFDDGFAVVHEYTHAGNATNTMTLSPNQCVRMEVRGVSDAGSLRFICAQVATEGHLTEQGQRRSVNTGHVAISCSSIGTAYPLIGLRKRSGFRDRTTKTAGLGAFIDSNLDNALFTVQKNPTLSGTPTWNDIAGSVAASAVGNGTLTVSTPGTVLFSLYATQGQVIQPTIFEDDYLSYLGSTIADVSDEIWLCVTPITATVGAFGALAFREF